MGWEGTSLYRQTGGEAFFDVIYPETQPGGTTTFELLGGVTHIGIYAYDNSSNMPSDLINTSGTLAPGEPFGFTTIQGDYTQLVGATTQIQLGGVVAGANYDKINAFGTVSLSGNLEVQLLNDFLPQPSHQFVIMTAANVTGVFDNAISEYFVGGGVFEVEYGDTTVTLKNFSPPPPLPSCLGDVDLNEIVDVEDLLALLGQWGDCPQPCIPDASNGPNCMTDIDRSCAVDVEDLLHLLGSWGECPIIETGACLLPGGACVINTEQECIELGGLGWSTGATCQDSDGDRLPDAFELDDCSAPSGIFVGTSSSNPDTDGDGILDGDEMLPTASGLDLRLLGADPLRINLFVEIDWMNDSINFAHSHQPTQADIDTLITAYANAPVPNTCGPDGIDLIVDYGQGGPFTGGNYLGTDTVVVFSSEFDGYKALNFDANRQGFFRYAIFCHRYNSSSNNSSGIAELYGDDFIVSLQSSLSVSNVTKTFMHEIGHNLGLLHGGFENLNYKPNYNSVMNYRYQFPGADSDCDAIGNGVLDYSQGTNLTLNELGLDENSGVCGSVSIDWDNDGTIDRSVIFRNINCPVGQGGDCGTQPGGCYDWTCDVLQDYNDWNNLSIPIPASLQRHRADHIVECQQTPPVQGRQIDRARR